MLSRSKTGTKKKNNTIGLHIPSNDPHVLDLPSATNRLVPPAKQAFVATYLIYVLLHTRRDRPPTVVLRDSYESLSEAVEAFKREYATWSADKDIGGLFPRCHSSQHLDGSYIINIVEMARKKAAGADVNRAQFADKGKVKVEYALIHKEDTDLTDKDPRKRKCVIICEQSSTVMAS